MTPNRNSLCGTSSIFSCTTVPKSPLALKVLSYPESTSLSCIKSEALYMVAATGPMGRREPVYCLRLLHEHTGHAQQKIELIRISFYPAARASDFCFNPLVLCFPISLICFTRCFRQGLILLYPGSEWAERLTLSSYAETYAMHI